MAANRYGEGSIHYDAKRDLWEGSVYFGPGHRPKVRARKKADMLVKLRKLQTLKDQGVSLKVISSDTVDSWLDTWLGTIVPRTVIPGTVEQYSKWARDWVRPHVGPILLDQLTVEDVDRMMATLETQGLSPRTVKQARNLLKRALAAAKKRGKVPTNVAEESEAPRIGSVKINDRLSADEAKAVLKTTWGEWLYPLALLCLSIGIRPGEAFALRWRQLDLRAGTLDIRGTKTRAAHREGIPLPGNVLDELRIRKARVQGKPADLIFTDQFGNPLKAREVGRWWHGALARADVPRRRFYATRHTAATLMLRNGVKLEVISKILGHSGYAITSDIYAEVGPEMERDAADIMNGVLALD